MLYLHSCSVRLCCWYSDEKTALRQHKSTQKEGNTLHWKENNTQQNVQAGTATDTDMDMHALSWKFSHFAPSTPLQMGRPNVNLRPQVVIPICQRVMTERWIPFFTFRPTAFGKDSLSNSGLTTLIAFKFFSTSTIFTASLSSSTPLLGSFVIFNLLCSCKPSKIVHVDHAASARVLVRQLLKSTHEILAHTGWWGMRQKHFRSLCVRTVVYDQDSVRVPPNVLGRRTPRTTSCTVLLRASLRPTRCSLQADSDDNEGTQTTVVTPPCPPTGMTIRLALLQLRHPPGSELVTFQQLRPVIRSTRPDRCPHLPGTSKSVLSPAAQLFFVWRFIDPRSSQTSSLRGSSWPRRSPGPESRATCTRSSRQLASPMASRLPSAPSSRLASDCNNVCTDLSCAARRRLPPSLTRCRGT